MDSQKKWTFFKITITNAKISLRTGDIVNNEYIHNANEGNKNGNVNNIDTWQNNIDENENVIFKKINNHKLNAFIVGYSDVNFTAGNIINEGNNNKEEDNKKYYYVLVRDITHRENIYNSLFSALENTATIGNKFTYSIEIIDANTTEVTDMMAVRN